MDYMDMKIQMVFLLLLLIALRFVDIRRYN